MRTFLTALALAGTLASVRPAEVQAQSLAELLMGIRQGGGWVSIPVRAGHGELTTLPVPTAGLSLSGCIQVWGGHSGLWDLKARDLLGTGSLDVHTQPGQPVVFKVDAGLRSQLAVDVRWSEARDTTLLLWVGLDRPGRSDRDSCQPAYGS